MGDRTKRYRTYAEAIAAAHGPDYGTGEHPPIATIRALIQAAWA